MAGRNAGFNGREFRKQIRFVMNLGAPPVDGEQATFYFPSQLIYNTNVDAEDVPFDPTATVTRNTPTPVKVPCAVEFKTAAGVPTDFGLIVPAHAEITLLDEDYAKVKGCTYVALRGEKYVYRSTDYPTGLFDVGVYVMHFVAEDQS
jgi:hypothetical protein